MADVVSFGSINVDLVRTGTDEELARLADEYEWLPPAGATVSVSAYPDLPDASFRSFLGGKGANQAVAAAEAGAATALLGKTGTDQAQYDVLDSLRDRDVDVDRVERADVPTGVAYIFVESDGTNRIAVVDGANGTVDESYVESTIETVLDAECLLLQNEIPIRPMEVLLDRIEGSSSRPTVLFDPSPVDRAERVIAHDAVDVVSVNESEQRALIDYLDSFDGTVVTTRGSDDVRVDGSETFTVSPPTVSPVDTTGAGDVFNGYLAAGLAAGETLRSAVELAVTAAALSTETEGAQNSIPSRADVLAFDRKITESER
jgi:ribokinase